MAAQLPLRKAQIMAQFVDDCLAYLPNQLVVIVAVGQDVAAI